VAQLLTLSPLKDLEPLKGKKMTASFKYNLGDFKVYSTDQAQNIVKSVRFEIVCEHMGQARNSFRPIEFAEPDHNNFTEFADLTQDQILAWVTAHLGQSEIDAMKFGLQSMIEHEAAQSKPTIETVQAPWL
jgi:hypothetical protein